MADAELIERLRAYFSSQDSTGFNVLDFIHREGSPLLALMYSRLFWPEFAEIDGMIFLKEDVENDEQVGDVREAFQHYGQNRQQTEKSFNRIDVPHLFGARIGDTTDEEDLWLATRLAEMWRCRLRELYPDRRFSVEVAIPEGDSAEEIGVLFYEVHESP